MLDYRITTLHFLKQNSSDNEYIIFINLLPELHLVRKSENTLTIRPTLPAHNRLHKMALDLEIGQIVAMTTYLERI